MADSVNNNDYGTKARQYPVESAEYAIESMKRFTSFPTPQEVFDFALRGLPKFFPLTNEPITVDMVIPFLESAITEIEMQHSMSLSPTIHHHPVDNWDNATFGSNYSGVRLPRWPATKIIDVRHKYPHVQTNTPYQSFAIPPEWVFLKGSKMNILASSGSVIIASEGGSYASGAAGILGYFTGMHWGTWQPGVIEITYQAGFDNDRLPSAVADLIKSWAAMRFIGDLLPVLFPNTGVSTSADQVSQSVTMNVAALLQTRHEMLAVKTTQLVSAIRGAHGRNIKMAFIGTEP
jgi:hypothetical protein